MIIPTYITPTTGGGRLYADAVTSLTPQYSATPTKYPISSKTQIVNNIIRQNPILNMSLFVGKHPLKSFSDSIIGYDDLDQRPTATHELLLRWFNNSTQLFIYSEFFNFSDYVITSYTPKQLEAYDTLQFDLTFEKLRFVSYEKGTLITFMDPAKSTDATGKSSQSDSSSKEKVQNKYVSDDVLNAYLKSLSNPTKEETSGN